MFAKQIPLPADFDNFDNYRRDKPPCIHLRILIKKSWLYEDKFRRYFWPSHRSGRSLNRKLKVEILNRESLLEISIWEYAETIKNFIGNHKILLIKHFRTSECSWNLSQKLYTIHCNEFKFAIVWNLLAYYDFCFSIQQIILVFRAHCPFHLCSSLKFQFFSPIPLQTFKSNLLVQLVVRSLNELR